MRRSALVPVLLLAAPFAGPARAQELLYTVDSPGPTWRFFGSAAARVPDTDGDGVDDFVVATTESFGVIGPGHAYVFSGATGALRYTLTSPNPEPGGQFGGALAGVPDANGDGRGDVLVGALYEDPGASPDRSGRAYLFDGATGALLRQLAPGDGAGFAEFGNAVAGVPDVNGDGRGDLAVGAHNGNDVYLFSGSTGALLRRIHDPDALSRSYFGEAVAGLGDVDGDGRGDLLVGAPGEFNTSSQDHGRAYVLSGATGAVLHRLLSANGTDGGYFGMAVAGVPDADGDGRDDVLVGARGERLVGGPEDAGRAYVFSGATGARLHTLESPNGEHRGYFGVAVSGVPDVDSDGRGDLLIGASGEDPGGSPEQAGRAYVFSGASGALAEVLASGAEAYLGAFGSAVAGLGDVDGDGRGDLLVGASGEASSVGRAYVFSGGLALGLTPLVVAFGDVGVSAASPPEAVTVENVSAGAVTLTGVTLGGDADAFEVVAAPPFPLTLPPGGMATVSVRFTPVEPGAAAATLVVASDAGNRTAALTGRGVVRLALTVTKTADTSDGACDADCSFREAVAAANASPGRDLVGFAAALAGQALPLAVGALVVEDALRVDGEALGLTVRIDASQASVLVIGETVPAEIVGLTLDGGFSRSVVYNSGALTLERCTLQGGSGGISNAGTLTVTDGLVRDNGTGGGIFNGSGAVATVVRTTIASNGGVGTQEGGGIHNEGTLTLVHATVSDNEAVRGGGIYNAGTLALRNVTVADNITRLGGTGGGLVVEGGTATLATSIVAGNRSGGVDGPTADCLVLSGGGIASAGRNVFGAGTGCAAGPGDAAVPPRDVFARVLEPALADNGGYAPTHDLRYLPDNPALDLGGACGFTDQRAVPAPLDGPDLDGGPACDAGAVEAAAPPVVVRAQPVGPPVVIPDGGGAFSFTATVRNATDQAQTLTAWTAVLAPGGAVVGPVVGPVTFTLAPGGAEQRTVSQQVPGGAPAGAYTYALYVGPGGGGAVSGASFPFTKGEAAGRRAAGATAAWATPQAWGAAPPGVDGAAARADGGPLFALYGARPNPFAARTALAFDLPEAARVRLVVYDVLGREVAVLVEGEHDAGRHGVTLDGRRLPSGSYLVRLEAGAFSATRRVTLVR